MSLAFLSKPIGGSKKEKDANPQTGGPELSGGSKPGPLRGGGANVTVGGSPRVDLMPPEIRLKRAQLRTRRKLRLGLFGVFVIVAVACAATWAWDGLAETSLASAQSQQSLLVAQQAKFGAVTTIKNSIALIKAGQIVGDSSEINWQSYLTKLQATLPTGVAITTVTVDSATPLKPYAQTLTPLQGDRIATLSFSATSSTLPSIPVWLNGLKTLPGFVDATPGTVTLTDTDYTVQVDMHINSRALANRFVPKGSTSGNSAADTTGGN